MQVPETALPSMDSLVKLSSFGATLGQLFIFKKKTQKKLNKHAFDQSLFYKNIIVCKSFNYSPILI